MQRCLRSLAVIAVLFLAQHGIGASFPLSKPLLCQEQLFVPQGNELEINPVAGGKFLLAARSTALPGQDDWKTIDPKTFPLVYLAKALGAPLDGSITEMRILFDSCVQDSLNPNLVACNGTEANYQPASVTAITGNGKVYGPIDAIVTFRLYEIEKKAALTWEADLSQQRSWTVLTPAASGPGHLVRSEYNGTVNRGHGYGWCNAR